MLIDAAKGVEPQTRKLFEVCRMRGIPIFTFINKMDRPSQRTDGFIGRARKDPGNSFDSNDLADRWAIAFAEFIYDRRGSELLFFQTEGEANVKGKLAPRKVTGVEDPEFVKLLGGPRNDLDARRKNSTIRCARKSNCSKSRVTPLIWTAS